jgi:hypothetical protein
MVHVPAVYPTSDFAKDGGLLSYGVDVVDNLRRAASMSIAFYAAQSRGSCPFNSRQNLSWS